MKPKKILFTAFGSLGDIHPALGLARALKERGHLVSVATHESYRAKVLSEGLGFFSLRPDLNPEDKALAEMVLLRPDGSKRLTEQIIMPNLRATFDDLYAALEGFDLLVNHMLVYSGPHAAEKRGLPWVSMALSPINCFSAYDPPTLVAHPLLNFLIRHAGRRVNTALIGAVKKIARSWSLPVHQMRAEVGLPRAVNDPLLEGLHSPHLVLALFSQVLAKPQPDWPPKNVVTGFPIYDKNDGGEELAPELDAFMRAGPAPIVFTLGSAAVMSAGDFYAESARAAIEIGQRAVLLIGKDPGNRPPFELPPSIGVFTYAPYSKIFHRAKLIVHQGGIGTTGQALRSGRPMLVVPFGIDQPDNAARLKRLGVARVLPRARYNQKRAVAELKLLIGADAYAKRAQEIAADLRRESGAATACDAIEACLN